MKAYHAWYSCWEEVGTIGYFMTMDGANAAVIANGIKVGDTTEFGDTVREIGVSEILIQEDRGVEIDQREHA